MVSELIEAIKGGVRTYVHGDMMADTIAQAALQAMIDHGPTDDMVEAAMRGRDGTIPAAVVRDIWRVMNAAAQGDG